MSNAPPPLPAWPSTVYQHEPAHAFFKRIARANYQTSARSLAERVGLNGRNINPQDFLEFCLSFPVADNRRLEAATPTIEGRFVHLAGELFRLQSDFSFRHPRVCGACVAELPYHRNWFDITAIGRCPFHDLPLVRGAKGAPLTWWHAEVAVTPAGEDLRRTDVQRVIDLPDTWDRYVLGRLGIADRLPCPFLDDQLMWQVIYAADVLGLAAATGWSNGPPDCRLSKLHPERGPVLQRGFEILRGGVPTIEGFLDRLGRQSPYFGVEKRITFQQLFGRFFHSAYHLSSTPIFHTVKEAMRAVGLRHGVFFRQSRSREDVAKGAPRTLRELSEMLQVAPHRLKKIALRLGILSVRRKKGEYHRYTDENVRRIQSALADQLPYNEALSLSGLAKDQFDARRAKREIAPFRITNAGIEMFLRLDIVTTKGLTLSELARALGIDWRRLRKIAMGAGVLDGAVDRGRLHRLNADQINRVRAELDSTPHGRATEFAETEGAYAKDANAENS